MRVYVLWLFIMTISGNRIILVVGFTNAYYIVLTITPPITDYRLLSE